MHLIKFMLRRLAHSIFVLLGLSVLVFFIARVMPGDPARMSLGPRAPETVVQKFREELHLDKPIYVQYYYWLKGALQGDFGMSLFTKRDVADDIREFFPATLELIVFTGIIMSVFGILLGVASARYANRWPDNVVRVFSYLGICTPAYVFGILFLLLFGYILNILPTIGRISPILNYPRLVTGFLTIDSLLAGDFRVFWDALKHLIMPGLALALGPMAQEARITRSSMTENLQRDFIALERSQAIPERRIMSRYLMRISIIPTVSVLGLDFASQLGWAFLVELIFNWPGLSRYGINVMLHKDLNAIVAVIMIIGLMFLVVNIIVDVIVGGLDPRIRLGAERSK
ncbi:MAG TPA: ABC transporter permease [Spirochaetota bacterium]|nr:ABC transporter permease [Spirochaetota bacterium]